ncbi:hypothetical protein DY000_02019691 [Brassica cretica]|uniref:Glycosyltransferase n=1 Tax=Brassica cretica TaxID=69181 RepID=A0ABQ7D280_BRACR|nr:hypothetical protein DY000_02019691 [Brassica cretica]
MEKSNGLQVILFPLPLQGCINPMIQLAKILHSRDGLSDTETRSHDINLMLTILNEKCESPFRDCLTKLLQSPDSETERKKQMISCLIHDSEWIFTEPLAKSLNLPRLVLNATKASFFRGHFALPQLRRERYLPLQDSEQEDPVRQFPPLRKKDVYRLLDEESEVLDAYLNRIYDTTKSSSGLIFMSCEELDQDSLTQDTSRFSNPNETCIPWLDKQEDRSVIYVSFGSLVTISESELLEIAWGLSNSDQPFLWVVRVGMVNGIKWIEVIPEEVMERLNKNGKIVKWAPQQEVLKHQAIGGYLTHNGWNSTVESVCEGVPMICLPFIWDQFLNARFVCDIWRVGLHLENRIERNEIERMIRILFLEAEGEAIRDRIELLKEKVGRSVKQNGSAYQCLEILVDHISSF